MHEPLAGFAVAVVRENGEWRCDLMDSSTLTELDVAITALRRLRSTGAVFGMLDVDEEFFVLTRPSASGVAVLLSDAAASLDYDIAADVLDLLRIESPDEDDDSLWPAGDLGILSDFGLSADELQFIVDDVDSYPDEQLQVIAQRCGFGDEFASLLDRIQL